MSDQVQVQLVAQDAAFIASTKAAAANMAALAVQETKVAEAAKQLGVDGKKFSTEFAKVEAKRAADASRVAKAEDTAQKKAAAQAEKVEKKAQADALKKKKAKEQYDKDYKAAGAEQLAQAAAMVGATAAFVVGIAAAAAGVIALAVEIGGAALKALELRENARGFFNVLTAGRGDKTLELVDKLAGSLGVKFNDARQQFIQFRQAGLDNKQSANLIKLAADLNTVDHSGELARQAISRVLSYTANATQTRDQAEASARAMKLLAKQAGIAGDGTRSAAEAATTLVGALNRLDNKKTQVLETIGERIKPSVDKAATAYANLVEKFLASKSGQRAIDLVAIGITKLADAATAAVPYVEKFAGYLADAANNPSVQTGLNGAKIVLEGIGIAAALVAAPFVALSAGFYAAGAAVLYLVGEAGKLVSIGGKLASDAARWGADLVEGLIGGIEASAGKLYKSVGGMAHNVGAAFKGALGIHSPSKVFAGFGVSIGQGVQVGIDRSMPSGADIANDVIPRGAAVQIRGGGSLASGASSGPTAHGAGQPIQVTIENLNVPQGEDPSAWMRAAGHELGLGMQAILLGQGVAA